MSHIEERQALRDSAFVQAEKDVLYWQEYFDELDAAKREHQKPAKIVVIEEKEYIPDEDILLEC